MTRSDASLHNRSALSTALALAVDVGGTKTEAALVDAAGSVLPGTRFRAPTGGASDSDALAAAVSTVVHDALGARPPGSDVLGVGIGSAGPVAEAEGLVSPLNLPAWREFALADLVGRAAPGIPVTLRSDGLCITLAEHWVGAGRDCANLLGMVVSTGIGGGLILHGNTVSGPTGNAGHIGHIEVGGFDEPCKCGGTGCVEAVASGPRSVAWARANGWTGSSGEDLARSYLEADPIAIAAVERAGTAIGQAIASAVALVDVEIVAIGGGFSRVSPDLFVHIRASIDRRLQFGFVRKVVVVPSELSDDGPLVGAGALVHRSSMVS